MSRARPSIAGRARAGAVLACRKGSWTNGPSAFTYRWSRDGTPITGATAASYTVQRIDEGNTLTCTVVAAGVGGVSRPVTSRGVAIAVPHVNRCPAATGTATGRRIGLVALGDTRSQAQRAYTQSSRRGRRYEEFFCLTPIGVRVGFASPKLLGTLPIGQRARYRSRVIWISTSSAHYAIRGIRPGATVTAARKRLRLGKVFHVGANDWYLAPDGPVRAIFKARHGIVQEIGIADRQMTKTRGVQRTFLTSFT